jgi:hypothetical protein
VRFYGPKDLDRTSLTLGMLTLCGAASMGFGGLNEVIEFFLTLTLPETNIGGYMNTGWDLVSNLVGVTLACGLIVRCHQFGNRK